MRVTAAEATIERLTRASAAAEKEAAERSTRVASGRSGGASGVRESRGAGDASGVRESRGAGDASEVRETRDLPRRRGLASSYPPVGDPQFVRGEPVAPHSHPRTDTPYMRPRPLNPALRSRPNWGLRFMTLILILGVIAAIVLVIHSTIA